MSWKFVFNSNGNHWWSDIDKCNEIATKAGYTYFTWNGDVYKIGKEKTIFKVQDLF